jgi:hypothetical protein
MDRGPLLSLALAGCLGAAVDLVDDEALALGTSDADATPSTDAGEATDDLAQTDDVVRFTANGSRLPGPEDAAEPVWDLVGHQGAEPNLGATSDGALFVTAFDKVLRSQDEGESWEKVYHYAQEDDGVVLESGARQTFDPMLWVDPVTDRVFADPMYPPLACSSLAWSDDGGESWTERPGVCHPPPMDHQKLASGVPSEEAPPVAGEEYPTVLYQCYNQLANTNCAVSYDGGIDWVVHTVASSNAEGECAGINGHPNVGPDGTVAVPITSSCDKPALAVSQDSGTTWSYHEVPTDVGSRSLDAEVNFTEDGTLYYTWRGDDHRTYVARSPDAGETWEGPWDATPPQVNSTAFHATFVGPDGRLATAFVGSPNAMAGPDEAGDEARWYLYIVTSEDADTGSPTFTGHRVHSKDDPVQVGRICLGGVGCDGSRNMLDFIDGAVTPDGTFHVAYTEGCVEECARKADAKPSDSRSARIAVARLQGWNVAAEAPDQGLVPDDPTGS